MPAAPCPLPAHHDPALQAVVRARYPLLYTAAPPPDADLPPHVRAGSGLTWWRGRLAVAQDDVHAVGLVSVDAGGALRSAEPLLLPRGPGGARVFGDDRGTKALKLDLEAALSVPDARTGEDVLLVFGSGSLPQREHVVVARGGVTTEQAAPVIVHAPQLYGALRATAAFAGSEMNIEAAVLVAGRRGPAVRLFNRGNGAPRSHLMPVNAHADLDLHALLAYLEGDAPPPEPEHVTPYALGAKQGVALGFTGAAALPNGRVLAVLAAEDSPDATRDGAVTGAALGLVGPEGVRWAPIVAPDGTLAPDKPEGVALLNDTHALLVTDPDDDARPSDLLVVELTGPWSLGATSGVGYAG